MLTHYLNIWLPAVGVVFLVFAYLVTMATDHLQARHWPQTTGKVVESAVEEVRGDSLPRESFVPRIRFTYYAAGKPRESRHFAFHVWNGSRVRAEATVARYPVGSVVTVYHHPNRPDQAVLDPQNAVLSVALATFAGLILIGMVAAWWGVSRAAAL
jgi:Protein of unknown function (DUF3592)